MKGKTPNRYLIPSDVYGRGCLFIRQYFSTKTLSYLINLISLFHCVVRSTIFSFAMVNLLLDKVSATFCESPSYSLCLFFPLVYYSTQKFSFGYRAICYSRFLFVFVCIADSITLRRCRNGLPGTLRIII